MYHLPYTILDMNDFDLGEPVDFDWDSNNQAKIRLKHGIIYLEAEQVLFNSPIVREDIKHSNDEQRFQVIGQSQIGKILYVIFTVRDKKIRIISARTADKQERQTYEETQKNSEI